MHERQPSSIVFADFLGSTSTIFDPLAPEMEVLPPMAVTPSMEELDQLNEQIQSLMF